MGLVVHASNHASSFRSSLQALFRFLSHIPLCIRPGFRNWWGSSSGGRRLGGKLGGEFRHSRPQSRATKPGVGCCSASSASPRGQLGCKSKQTSADVLAGRLSKPPPACVSPLPDWRFRLVGFHKTRAWSLVLFYTHGEQTEPGTPWVQAASGTGEGHS